MAIIFLLCVLFVNGKRNKWGLGVDGLNTIGIELDFFNSCQATRETPGFSGRCTTILMSSNVLRWLSFWNSH